MEKLQLMLLKKLELQQVNLGFIINLETPGLDGVVFLLQFNFYTKINLIIVYLKNLNNNYEIHFARENMSFKKIK